MRTTKYFLRKVQDMRFHKNTPQEVRAFLQAQLKEYEANTPMSKEERRELHKWVAKGRSPYDNGDYICGADWYPLDFISALRAEKELQDWFESLSEEEKEAERQGCSYQYATETDEIYFDISTFQITDVEDDDLPSNNMRINKNNAKIGGLI